MGPLLKMSAKIIETYEWSKAPEIRRRITPFTLQEFLDELQHTKERGVRVTEMYDIKYRQLRNCEVIDIKNLRSYSQDPPRVS